MVGNMYAALHMPLPADTPFCDPPAPFRRPSAALHVYRLSCLSVHLFICSYVYRSGVLSAPLPLLAQEDP
eukprot:1188252-Prorocentrum_minimum.AAC.4